MSNDDDDLKELFERMAQKPSPFELTRMAARARELPSRLDRVPRRIPRWTWAPAFAAVAALGALGVTLMQARSPEQHSSPSRHEPLPSTRPPSLPEPSKHPVPSSPAPASSPPPEDQPEAELDPLFGADLDDDPFDLSSAEELELSK